VRIGNSPISDKYLETELLRSCGLYSIHLPSQRLPVHGTGVEPAGSGWRPV